MITGGNPRRWLDYPFSDYEIEYVNLAMNPGANPIQSTGSGVTYWPARNTFLLLDNTTIAPGVVFPYVHEYNRDGTHLRFISLDNFGDTEEIHWISGNTFLFAQENNTAFGNVDELALIELPTGGGDQVIDISSAIRRIQPNNFTSVDNRGIEGACLVGNDIYFTTEEATTAPAEWNCWKVENIGTGITSVSATKIFNLKGALAGIARDLAGMTLGPDGNLWMLSDQGAVAGGMGRLIRVTLDGRLVENSTLPKLADGVSFAQAEGIEFFLEDGVKKLILSGEDSTGVDFMILKPPTP